MKFSWQGVFPAIITPFQADDRLDLDMFGQNLSAQLHAGVDGIIIGGSLGEASTLTTEEKQLLVAKARSIAGDEVPLIVNIAESSTREAISQAGLSASWGADGLMLLPPMRYKSDDRETVEYFKTIAASTNLPVMIYNNPIDYKIDVTIALFEELIQCPNITAVKESTRDVTNVTRLRNRFGDRLAILCGVDTLALEELLLGADGWVAGLVNAFPKETVAIYRLAKAGRIAEATAIYRWFMPLLELDIHPKLVQYIKLATEITGIGSEHVRAPRLALAGAERERILQIITDGVKASPPLPADLWG